MITGIYNSGSLRGRIGIGWPGLDVGLNQTESSAGTVSWRDRGVRSPTLGMPKRGSLRRGIGAGWPGLDVCFDEVKSSAQIVSSQDRVLVCICEVLKIRIIGW